MAPHKELKVSASSTAHRAAEVQAVVQRGTASGEAVPEEPTTQEQGAEAATERVGEQEPTPRDVVGLGATEVEVSTTAEAMEDEAGAPKTSEAGVADAGDTEVKMAEVIAPGSVEAEAVRTEAGPVLAPPPMAPTLV